MSTERLVSTTHGSVRTTHVANGVVQYRGMPYAAAPFGAHRLLAPAPARPWEGVRDCCSFGAAPPQPPMFPGMPRWLPGDSLEVLTANVFTPDSEQGQLPVLVWIYGGAYRAGSAAEYDASELVRAGMVVVSFNYRVGFEGFGHIPGRPDNRGLLDQVAALRWVRENIAAFGGDPANVTIAGESAGAGSVVCLMVMPEARGLFRRSIAHSVPSEFFSVATARAIAERIARVAGVEFGAEGFDAMTPERLIDASDDAMADIRKESATSIRHYAPTIFSPVVDGTVLPLTPLAGFEAGHARAVDFLACHTLHEYRLFPVIGLGPRVSTEEELRQAAAAFEFPVHSLPAYLALSPGATPYDVFTAIASDRLFGELTSRLAERHASAGGRAYFSRFAWESPVLNGQLRACHALDVPFVFGQLDRGLALMLLGGPPKPEEQALSGRMIRAWADFTKRGEPGWPAIAGAATPVRTWNRTDQLVMDDRSGTRALWKDVEFGAG